jgi:hypothetical protein
VPLSAVTAWKRPRVFEGLARSVGIAACEMNAALGLACRAEQRGGRGRVGDRTQFARGCGGLFRPAGVRLRGDQQFQSGRALGRDRAGHSHVAGGAVGGVDGIAALERDLGTAQHRERVMLGPGEQRGRLVGSPLAPAQIGQRVRASLASAGRAANPAAPSLSSASARSHSPRSTSTVP